MRHAANAPEENAGETEGTRRRLAAGKASEPRPTRRGFTDVKER